MIPLHTKARPYVTRAPRHAVPWAWLICGLLLTHVLAFVAGEIVGLGLRPLP